MPQNLARKLIASHLAAGRLVPGEEIALKIDQTLTQDAAGTLVMLELEALGLKRVRTELPAQHVDQPAAGRLQECRRPPLSAQRLPEVRNLAQPAGKRGEPSGAYGTLRGTGQESSGIGQPDLRSLINLVKAGNPA